MHARNVFFPVQSSLGCVHFISNIKAAQTVCTLQFALFPAILKEERAETYSAKYRVWECDVKLSDFNKIWFLQY